MKNLLIAALLIFGISGCSPGDPSAGPPVDYPENWVVYSTLLEGNPAVVAVDLGLQDIAPAAGYTELVRISLPARQTDANGFPVDSELKHMIALEEKLETGARNRGAILIGRTTTAGYRNLFFAAGQGRELEKLVKGQLGNSDYQVAVKKDPSWAFFTNYLLPGPFETNRINNERILTRMEEAGDNLQAPRPVEHWFYFREMTNRSQMANWLIQEGFEVLDSLQVDEKNDLPLQLHVARTEQPVHRHIHELTWQLYTQAAAFNGAYEGWEAPLVRKER